MKWFRPHAHRANLPWLVLSLICLLALSLSAQESRFRPPVISPEVSAERTVTFRVRAPDVETLRLTGGDMPEIGRGLDMVKSDEGVWERTVGPVAPGAYRYRFEISSVPVSDPGNPATSESNSNSWSVVHVPGADWMDVQAVPHGAVAEVFYYSKSLERNRRMHVYTPPGYEAGSEEKYPVFYLLHGATDSDDSWTSVGRAGFILDNLIAEKAAKPMLVVMPAGHTGPFWFGRGGMAMEEFVKDFVSDIKPYVEANYRVRTDRQSTAIAGLSMGGAQTLSIGIPHLDQFAYLGVFSSGVFGITGQGPGDASEAAPSFEQQHAGVLEDAALKDDLRLCWFSIGKDDFLLGTSRATVEMLEKHGFDVEYRETEGGHTWSNWRQYLRDFAPRLFQD